LIIVPFVAVGASAYADDLAPLPGLDQPAAAETAAKPHPKKNVRKSAAAKPAKASSEDAEKAARIEEGRKKFFEQSMGFDNGGSSSNSNVTLTNENGGISPAMGMKF
jgi:flagellar biosynthesis/type III secretory pathway protein FliH